MKLFDSIRVLKPKRNKFDLSYERKMTMNMGPLYPCYVEEVLPGDTFRVNSQVFLRFLALIAPVMHRVDVTVHYFFVPNRLIWTNWPDFITGGRDGLAAPVSPYFTLNNVAAISSGATLKPGSLLDYFGFPTMPAANTYSGAYTSYQFNALPLRAYLLIYENYYRDQNVEASVLTANFLADGNVTGADLTALVAIRQRAWEKDYLTSALPWTQRGGAVTVPITGTVTVPSTGANQGLIRTASGGATAGASQVLGSTPAGGNFAYGSAVGSTNTQAYYDPNGSMTVNSSSLTINALRLSNQLQVWLERNARAGGRYIEQLAAHFGVISSDARLQRPEYLGGGKSPVVVSEVLQTAPAAGGSTPLAQLAGHGISVGSTNTFKKFFEEHGHVIGLISVLPKTAYQQSCDPMWTGRNINTGYYFPEFANLGEQAVINGCAYSDWSDAAAGAAWSSTFGYQSRYAEYKYHQDEVCGQFKETLKYWHFGRQFAAAPALNTAFIQSNPRTDPFAVQTDVDHIVCQIYHRVDALRPIPYFSEPRL